MPAWIKLNLNILRNRSIRFAVKFVVRFCADLGEMSAKRIYINIKLIVPPINWSIPTIQPHKFQNYFFHKYSPLFYWFLFICVQ